MRTTRFVLTLLAIAVAISFMSGTNLPAQEAKVTVAQLQKKLADLKKEMQEILEFQKRLCKILREENIMVFATVPKTDEEKVIRCIEKFKGAVSKANQAMATRNPALHQRADALRVASEKALTKLKPEMVIPALKAEIESSGDDFIMCSSMMAVLGTVGKQSVLPYMQNIVEDKKRPGYVRRIASETMLNVDKEKAIDILVPVAGDVEQKDFQDRYYVIYLLSETKDPRVEPMLLKGAKTDPDKSARCHHINGLAHFKTAEARATLEWVIANDEYEHARTNALASLHRMVGDEAAYLLMKEYSQKANLKSGQPDYRVRNAAYQSMNRIKVTLEREGKAVPGEAPKETPKKEEKPK